MTFFPDYKPTIWQRIKWFFFGKPKFKVPEVKSITHPIVKADFPNLNRNVFTEDCLKNMESKDE